MKMRSFFPVLMLGFAALAPMPKSILDRTIQGNYVEARTCSVFAGACHYNGELVTSGRDAILAWSIAHGQWNGVDLAGVRAMAAISSDQNLGDESAARSCQLVIDPSATRAQADAFTDWLKSVDATQLGKILPVQRSTVSFAHQDGEYIVSCDALGGMSVRPMPNNECCTQPHLVWYNPLMPLEHRKVGFTETASYTAGTVGDPWDRSDENSAFYGTFSSAGK